MNQSLGSRDHQVEGLALLESDEQPKPGLVGSPDCLQAVGEGSRPQERDAMLFSEAFVRALALIWETVSRAVVWGILGSLVWTMAHAAGAAPALHGRHFLYLFAAGAWLALDHASDSWELREPKGAWMPYWRRLVIDGCFGVLFAMALTAVLPNAWEPWGPLQTADYIPFALGAGVQGFFACAVRRLDWPALASFKDPLEAAAAGMLASLVLAIAAGKVMTHSGSFDDATLTGCVILGAGLGLIIQRWRQPDRPVRP
jgi:hypothetical protein